MSIFESTNVYLDNCKSNHNCLQNIDDMIVGEIVDDESTKEKSEINYKRDAVSINSINCDPKMHIILVQQVVEKRLCLDS